VDKFIEPGFPSKQQFETGGLTWAERAPCGELNAVISPTGASQRNLFIHSVCLYAGKLALRHHPSSSGRALDVLDYGCGTGRFIRFFGARGCRVTGVDITPEMLVEAQKFGLPSNCTVRVSDGITIPIPSASVDLVWVCGVLKYCLFAPGAACRGGQIEGADQASLLAEFKPTYSQLAAEMFRVLRPGGIVANYEIYVDVLPDVFEYDFVRAGFHTETVRVLQRYTGLEEGFQKRRVPNKLVPYLASLSGRLRFRFDSPTQSVQGFRDYFFVWRKPATP
jgi:SAM-dependent methyltransferase